jgi:PAS domain S-box-containing protein
VGLQAKADSAVLIRVPPVAPKPLPTEVVTRLERDAGRAIALRTRSGPLAYAAAVILFDVFSGVWSRAPWLTGAVTAAVVVACATRRALNRPERWERALGDAAWQRWFTIATMAMVVAFSAYFAACVHVLGLSQPLAMLLVVLATLVSGGVYSLAPRLHLARALAAGLLVPATVAILWTDSPSRAVIAPLMGVYLAFSMDFASRLHEEYWRASRSTAELAERTRELASSQEQMRGLIENIPDAVLLVVGGQIAFVNEVCGALLGRAVAEVVGQPLTSLVYGADASAMVAFLSAPAEQAGSPREVRFCKKDGTPVTWELLPSQPFELDGQSASLLVARDLTERNRLRDRLVLSEKLVTVGTLAAGMAHEVNNPLTYVTLNLDHIIQALRARTAAPDDKEILKAAIEARDGAARVQAIVHELKGFYSSGGSVTASADVHEVIDRALRLAQVEIRHRAQVKVIKGAVPRVVADEGKLAVVMLNLLMNAAQAIEEGPVDRNSIVVETSRGAAGEVIVTVSDTGRGIPAHALPRIFDPFFTTKAVGEGTGLGLSACHSALLAVGGDITATSEVGKGTVFTVTLRPFEGAIPAAPPARVSIPIRSKRRVLIVDDEAMVSRAVQRVYRRHADVVCEESAQDALARLEADEPFDLVICDLMMPDMTGMDLYERLETVRPQVAERFVFMTGGACTDRARAFLDRIRNPVLDKPASSAALLHLLESCPATALPQPASAQA